MFCKFENISNVRWNFHLVLFDVTITSVNCYYVHSTTWKNAAICCNRATKLRYVFIWNPERNRSKESRSNLTTSVKTLTNEGKMIRGTYYVQSVIWDSFYSHTNSFSSFRMASHEVLWSYYVSIRFFLPFLPLCLNK